MACTKVSLTIMITSVIIMITSVITLFYSYHAISLIPDTELLADKSRLADCEKCFQLSNSHTHPSQVLPLSEEAARAKLPSRIKP